MALLRYWRRWEIDNAYRISLSPHMHIYSIVLETWFSLMSTLEEALKQVEKPLEVIGLFEGVSKVVPLWHISQNDPHGKTL
jgi:hypothetical protein